MSTLVSVTIYCIDLTSKYSTRESLVSSLHLPRKGKILIADDNHDMRDYVCSLLRRKWECVAVGDGLEALTTLQNNPGYFDLVLSDIMVSFPPLSRYLLFILLYIFLPRPERLKMI